MIMKYFKAIGITFACLMTLGFPATVSAQNGTPGKPVVDTIRDKTVTVSWASAERIYGLFDDFESHKDFAINSPGTIGWQYADMDHDREYLIGDYQFENAGTPAAFRVWNPLQTVPAYTTPRGLPHSGDKCLISFSTMNNYRNDWLISPDLTPYAFTDSIRLSFWARSFNSSFGGDELVKIGYSTTDAKVSSFQFLNGGVPYEIPESQRDMPEMYYFEFKFPSTAKYIAINCVTVNGQALLIDDIAIGTNKVMPNKSAHNYLLGYNLYRNNTKVNNNLITQTVYTDLAPDYGAVTYAVEAVFEDGATTRSETLSTEIPDIRLLPFTERWDEYTLTQNFWVTNPDKADSYWTVDYLEGGLVIPAATFKPGLKLENYSDYWLESKELSAKGLDGVILAYDMAFHHYNLAGGGSTEEYVKVEVWDGTQWRTVKTHTSANSSFPYTRFYIDLSEYVKDKYFKIRFNGGGASAFSVGGWYISYVKVYEKEKATVSGTTTFKGTPVAGVNITWTSQDEDIYTSVSGADGTYRITDMDAGTYTVTATKEAYNPFQAENVTLNKGAMTYDFAMTQPAFAAPVAEQTYTLVAEATEDGLITLQNTGNGNARVNIDIDYANLTTNQTPALKPIKTFRPKDVLQSSICFDGTYFYTARSDEYGEGIIEKYDRDGNYLESFQPSIHVRRYFGMVFDGQDFYSANNDNIIRRIDMDSHEIIGEIVTPIENINHIAYDETRDAFYVGCLNSIALVDKNGRIIEEEVTLSNVLFSGSVYDPYFKDGPTMWIMDQSQNNPANGYTFAVLRRFDLRTKTVKDDYTLDCGELPGFIYGNNAVGKVWGECMFGTTRYLDGHFVMMGIILSDPGLVFILDMYEVENWLRPGTYKQQVAAGETLTVPYVVDAANLPDGTSREATVRILFDPAIPAFSQKIKVTVNGKAALAKPNGLSVAVQNDKAAVLTWQAANAANAPQSYRIYRNGEMIGTASSLTYTDNNLKAGVYRYEVTALYAGGESNKSAAVEAEIITGIPCYKPQNLAARNVRNEEIVLTWQNPSAVGDQPAALCWGNGRVNDYLNMVDGSAFIGASLWTASELADYRDMRLTAVTFVPMSSTGLAIPNDAQYTVYIWEDGVLTHKQAAGKDFKAGEPYTVTLTGALTINDSKSLRVGVEVSGIGAALGLDAGPARNGSGNWIYSDNFGSWMTLYAAGSSANANFIVSLDLQPKAQPETNTTQSYNVYRNNVKINTSPVTATTYTDRPSAGNYTYTVTAVHGNCESYGSNPVQSRIVDLKAHDAPEELAARVTMNRYVRLNWNYPNYSLGGQTAKSGYRPFAYVKDFDLNEVSESSIVTDGEYLYTSFYNRNGTFNKYDLQGNFIESFTIAGVGPMLDLTWDGTYFYGGGNTTDFYCMDFQNRTLVKKMTVTIDVRHCTYIPELDGGKGGFEIGDWTSSYFVSMNGSYLDKGYQSPEGAFGSAYCDGKLYFFQQRRNALCEIIEVDFATLAATGNRADLNLYSQYSVNENATAGGICTFTSLNGSSMLLANIQNGVLPNKSVWVEATPNDLVTGFNIYRDNVKLNGATPLSEREYNDTLSTPGTYSYAVAAIFIDGVEGEKSEPVNVKIVEATHCEAPVNVKAVAVDRDVRLQWTSVIDGLVATDDLESYVHLTTDPIGNYRTIDADGKPTYAPTDWTFNGAGNPAAFFVLDQRSLTPAQRNLAFSGNRFIAAFGAAESPLVAVNYAHDWLILPAAAQTDETQWISFMARGLDIDNKEAFRIAYSAGSADTTDFIRVSQKWTYVNSMWTRFTFDLPADAKYVAIEYLSGNGKALFIDDLSVGTGTCLFETDASLDASETFVEKVAGYTVFRDGEPLTKDPVHANSYFDGNLPNGSYSYTVQALYNTSCVSSQSSAVKVTIDFKAPQYAPTGLQGVSSHDTVKLNWNAPPYVQDKMLRYVVSDVEEALGFTNASVYYAVQEWEPSDLLGVFGYQLSAVTAFFAYTPLQLDLLIYQNDELVYEQDVTGLCNDMDVSIFPLDEPFTIDYAKSLKVGFRIDAEAEMLTIGFDKGPVMDGGDLYSNDGIHWMSADYYLGTGGNWYMAVLMQMPMPASGYGNGFQGYLVYRDGEPARKELVADTKYVDYGLEKGTHTYAVSAVYPDGEKMSESITVRVLSNEALDENHLYLFPNPTSDYFTVYGPFTRLEMTDLQGKVQLVHEAAQGAEVSVATLKAGLYFVRITSEAGTTVRKLVVK